MSAVGDFLALRNLLITERVRQDLSQHDVAAVIGRGVTRQTVSAWETGANFPPGDKLFIWASVLGVRIVGQPPCAPADQPGATENCAVPS